MSNIEHTTIGHVYIPTTNIDDAVSWYEDNLGLILGDRFYDRGSLIAILKFFTNSKIAIILVETKDQKPLNINRNDRLFPVLSIYSKDIEKSHAYMVDHGIKVTSITTQGDNEAKYFYFYDLDGNLLEIAWSIWDPNF